MKITTTLAAIALALSPTFVFAQGCLHSQTKEASLSCAAGTSWDEATKSCLTTTS
jgi:hypothetical protein